MLHHGGGRDAGGLRHALPLRHGGKAVRAAGLLRKPLAELNGPLRAHGDGGPALVAVAAVHRDVGLGGTRHRIALGGAAAGLLVEVVEEGVEEFPGELDARGKERRGAVAGGHLHHLDGDGGSGDLVGEGGRGRGSLRQRRGGGQRERCSGEHPGSEERAGGKRGAGCCHGTNATAKRQHGCAGHGAFREGQPSPKPWMRSFEDGFQRSGAGTRSPGAASPGARSHGAPGPAPESAPRNCTRSACSAAERSSRFSTNSRWWSSAVAPSSVE